jgi:type IV pilus assembly protein PilB
MDMVKGVTMKQKPIRNGRISSISSLRNLAKDGIKSLSPDDSDSPSPNRSVSSSLIITGHESIDILPENEEAEVKEEESIEKEAQEAERREPDELLERARKLDKVSSRTSCAEILLKEGLITAKELREALSKHGDKKDYFHQVFADMKLVPREKILEVAARDWGVPGFIDLKETENIDQEVIKMIPETKARRGMCIPVYKTEKKLSVAMANPLDIFAADDIKMSLRATGFEYEIEPLLAYPKDINEKLEETYGFSDAIVQEILDGISVDDISVESPADEQEDEIDIARSLEAAQRGPIISLVNAILLEAVKQGATDIHIEPFGKKTLLRYRIDSRLRDVPQIPLPGGRHNAIVSRIKIMAQCDIAERRLPQDGRIPLTAAGKRYDLRVSIVPSSYGESVVMRVLDTSRTLSLEELGFLPNNLRRFENAIKQPYGLILVTGPTGSGKTTTLYSSLDRINSPEVKVLTVENPVERNLPGTIQVQTKPEIELDFASILKYFLRHDPDIIMIGEIRDRETATTAVEAALTGHLVFSTLHTNDAPSSIIRLKELGINEFLLASSVQLAMAQRLVRRICEKCKRPIAPTARMLNILTECGVDTEKLQLYKGDGCSTCSGIGLRGMTAIHEVLEVDDDIRQLILSGNFSGPQIRRLARTKGMKTLREDGMEKVARGITTFEEVELKTMKAD